MPARRSASSSSDGSGYRTQLSSSGSSSGGGARNYPPSDVPVGGSDDDEAPMHVDSDGVSVRVIPPTFTRLVALFEFRFRSEAESLWTLNRNLKKALEIGMKLC